MCVKFVKKISFCRFSVFFNKKKPPKKPSAGLLGAISTIGIICRYVSIIFTYALPTEPNSSIFSLTVALMAS